MGKCKEYLLDNNFGVFAVNHDYTVKDLVDREPAEELHSIYRMPGPSFISASPIFLGPCQAF